jgi:hypothetical protein
MSGLVLLACMHACKHMCVCVCVCVINECACDLVLLQGI